MRYITAHVKKATQRTTTRASYSHHAQIFDAPPVYLLWRYRESLSLVTYPSRYWDTGFERYPRHGCRRSIWGYMRQDSSLTHIALLAKLLARMAQRPG